MSHRIAWPLVLLLVVGFQTTSRAQSAKKTDDLKTLNGHFPFVVPDSVDDWNERAESLRRRVLVATGLWPLPEKPALDPVLHSKIERDGFTIEKVYFQSLPGHFVTGMLFRPAPENKNGMIDGKRPGVLSPHGHGGRTMRLDDAALAKQIESGGEVFKQSGRYPKLARCAHLARMGCVTFIFDMLGYADSQQIDYKTAHRHADPRPAESDRDQACFYSIDADLNLQTIMGLQTWNAIRSLDFLAELPDVDAERLGVTGGSGGGTQTILLDAIDPRIKVGFPNGMVSTSMQGGCYCENCNYLRIGTGNVELAALFAPKPQGMTAANDWTKDMLTDGYPQLQQLYSMLGAKDDVMCGDLLKYPHNYNYITRSMMYTWMAEHLGLPKETPLAEKDFREFSEAEMKVWNDDHPAPTESGITHERNVLAWWRSQNDQQLGDSIPEPSEGVSATSEKLAAYRDVVGGAWHTFFDRELPAKKDLVIENVSEGSAPASGKLYRIRHRTWNVVVKVLVTGGSDASGIDTLVLAQPSIDLNNPAAVATPPAETGRNTENLRLVMPQLVALSDSQPLINDERSYSAFTFGYNRPLVVKQFEQLLCVLSAFAPEGEGTLMLNATGTSAPAGVAAAVVAGDLVTDFRVATDGFRFERVTDYSDAAFLPGAVKYFDLPGLMSLRAPYAMTVTNEGAESLGLVKQIYATAGATEQLEIR